MNVPIRAAVAFSSLTLLTGCGAQALERVPAPATSTTATASATAPPSSVTTPAQDPTPSVGAGSALAELATLSVKGRAPMTGYARERFGPAWLDADRNGCDTRNDLLGDYLDDITYKAGTGDCAVLEGDLSDPYTGVEIHFVRGDGALVDIDHVVALGNVWVTGGFRWDVEQRAAIANDPMNLLPVDASANRQKGDGDAATWLPPAKGYRCDYVARQIGVKQKYGLWVTPPEKAAMERVLSTCPGQPALEDSGAPVRVTLHVTDPGPRPDPAPATTPEPTVSQSGGGSVSYENCDAARAAGVTPLRRGDPGYAPHLDRDGDGFACT